MIFPGQIERLDFTFEQVERLASPVRSAVFWTFTSHTPQSVAEVAQQLGKSAQTIHYHVNELLEVGLLVAVETRQKGARTETLYVHKGRTNHHRGPEAGPEYYAMWAKGFRFTAKTLVDETEGLFEAIAQSPERGFHNVLSLKTVRLSPDQIQRLRLRLREIIEELVEEQPEEGGTRTHVFLYAHPTLGQLREWEAEEEE
ncbi:ArsR family transcriptional regulator [bacterium]|nr:MAG: ArsR family transcriptional regulator [bacterium]